MSADLILFNGQFHTVDRSKPLASAVAIKDGRFVVVGNDAQAMALLWRDISPLYQRHQADKRQLMGKWALAWLGTLSLLLLLLWATRASTRKLMLGHQARLQERHRAKADRRA